MGPSNARSQHVRTQPIDDEIERVVLDALTPDKLTIALATMAEVEREEAALSKQWQLRLERARYEAERARRQFDTVEPENRLVARTLETQWEDKLRAVEQLERDYENWRQRQQLIVTAEDRELIRELARDLPTVWSAPTTTASDRKQLIRLLIDNVLIDSRRQRGRIWLQINWRTGATTEHHPRRRAQRYTEHADYEQIESRIRELHSGGLMDEAIASVLNDAGFITARGQQFCGQIVHLLRKHWGLPTWNPLGPNPSRWDDGSYSVTGAAELLEVIPGTILKWLRKGVLHGWQAGDHKLWHVSLPYPEVARIRARLERTRRVTHSKIPAS